jgi:cellobiose phosphorylase
MYRLAVEGFLGLKKSGDQLELTPRIPQDWSDFSIIYRYGSATYEIEVHNPNHVRQGIKQVTLNGQLLEDKVVSLSQANSVNKILILMG